MHEKAISIKSINQSLLTEGKHPIVTQLTRNKLVVSPLKIIYNSENYKIKSNNLIITTCNNAHVFSLYKLDTVNDLINAQGVY